MTIKSIITRLSVAAIACSLVATARAAGEGSDDASASAYKDGWADNSNGSTKGTAFGPWYFAIKPDATNDAGRFLGDSTKLGDPALNVNTAEKSFGLYGKNANGIYSESSAYRDFDSGLKVGQTFSIDLAVNYRNGIKGIDIRGGTAGATDRPVLFTFVIASDDYAASNAATGNGSTKWEYKTSAPIHLTFTQTSTTGGTWKITREKDSAITGTYTGVATGFKLFCGNTDGTDSDNLFANHLMISH